MAKDKSVIPDVESEPVENGNKKKSKFDKFVDKYFAPSPNTDFFDVFSLAGLAVYGILKLVSKTRIKYKKWKARESLSKTVQRKVNRIKASRENNFKEAKSLDDMSPEIRVKARKIAKDMIKGKSEFVKGKSEKDLAFDIGKMLQEEVKRANEQNPWVDKWKAGVEQEIWGEVYEGKRAANSQQMTDQFIKDVNSDRWLLDRANMRADAYVTEMVNEDPSLKGQESRLREEVYSQAYEQALTDRKIMNDLKAWQDERRASMLKNLIREPEKKEPENKEPEQKEPENKEPERKEPEQKKAEQKEADQKEPEQKENVQKENDQAKPQVPVAKQQQMPRWWSGAVLDSFLATDLKPPAHGEKESNERREFRESVERLSQATKDPARKGDLLVDEYVDVYENSKKFNQYLEKNPKSPEQTKGKELAKNMVDWLNYQHRIDNYKNLHGQDLGKVNNLAQRVAEKSKDAAKKEIKLNEQTRSRRNAIHRKHVPMKQQEEYGLGIK